MVGGMGYRIYGRVCGKLCFRRGRVEVDGFIEDETEVVEYGVRYVRNFIEGEFIVFSTWILSWLLLINGRVKDSRYV